MTVNYSGRKALKCKKCDGGSYFVNRMGGIQCGKCSPPIKAGDSVTWLVIEDGFWQERDWEKADLVEPAKQGPQNANTSTGNTDNKQAPLANTPNGECGGSESPLNGFVVSYGSRGLHGEISGFETDIFLSDEVWESDEDWICLRPKKQWVAKVVENSASASVATKHTAKKRVIPERQRKLLPTIGSSVTIPKRLETFGGFVGPGEFEVSGAGYDANGAVLLNLSKNGRVMVSGILG
jgi:hypothetical protein